MTPFEHLRNTLMDGQTYGVWSLIVSFFGDMAQGETDKVPASVLTSLGERLNIKPEAMRVALHRLRKDGWVESQKTGRRSAYFLTKRGRLESADASVRIYARVPPVYSGLRILLFPQAREFASKNAAWIAIGNEVCISFDRGAPVDGDQVLTAYSGPVPDWISRSMATTDIVDGYSRFQAKLGSVSELEWSGFSPIETAALRVLIIHGWRRLLLKHLDLPDEAFPESCPIGSCRREVFALLGRVPRPDIARLSELDQATLKH